MLFIIHVYVYHSVFVNIIVTLFAAIFDFNVGVVTGFDVTTSLLFLLLRPRPQHFCCSAASDDGLWQPQVELLFVQQI
jgi:hypothetical protein